MTENMPRKVYIGYHPPDLGPKQKRWLKRKFPWIADNRVIRKETVTKERKDA